jgi:hypothetical protein
MRPSVEYVERKFEEFNNLIFGGKLPKLPFKITSARTFLGQVKYFREKNDDGNWHYYGFTFYVSDKFDLPEDVVEDTIIHEMIHYYICYNQMQDNAPHGDLFRQKMEEINNAFDRHITVVHKGTKEEASTDTEKRRHLICVSRFKDGQRAITVSADNPRILFRIWDEIERMNNIDEFKWVYTTDPFFNNIPRAQNAKFYIIPIDDLRPHLTQVEELVRRGYNVKVGKPTDLSNWL